MTTDTDPRDQTGAHSHRRYWTVYREPERRGSDPRAVIVYVAFALLSGILAGGVGAWWVLTQ